MEALTLPSTRPVYLDASGFIYSVERIEPYRTLLEPMWRKAQAGQFVVASSDLSVLETLVKPLRERDTRLEQLFRSLLNANEVQLVPTVRDLWQSAAHLRAATGLKTPDALHEAAARHVQCTAFITNYGGFRRVEDLPVVILDDHVSES